MLKRISHQSVDLAIAERHEIRKKPKLIRNVFLAHQSARLYFPIHSRLFCNQLMANLELGANSGERGR
jgi:hypothetical protein